MHSVSSIGLVWFDFRFYSTGVVSLSFNDNDNSCETSNLPIVPLSPIIVLYSVVLQFYYKRKEK